MGSKIEKMIRENAPNSVQIFFSRETTLLETAGGIAYALPQIDESCFAVINADIYTEYDFSHLKNMLFVNYLS